MRLRSPSRAVPGEVWVTASTSPTRTRVGNLDSPERGLVDGAGRVGIVGRSWSLDWWIGAEDRWHVPAREATLRQALVGASPVVETRLRVPSCDAVHRVYGARGPGGEDSLVVEVRNDSRVPFALALAVRPEGVDAPGGVRSIALDRTTVHVDGAAAVLLPRPAGRAALGTAATGDAAEEVFAGRAQPVPAARVRCPAGLAHAVVLFPLAHTASVRVVLPLASATVDPGRLPTAEQVASGWEAHGRRAARVEVPDRRLREALRASGRHLLLEGADPRWAASLDLLGFAEEATRALLADPGLLAGPAGPGTLLHALAWHWALTRDPDQARASVPLLAALAPALARSGVPGEVALGRAALPLVAEVLEAAGERLGAADVGAMTRPDHPAPTPGDDLASLMATAGPTWTWATDQGSPDLRANATLVALVRRMLVEETAAGLALSPGVPAGWLGQGWEVHDAPTRWGRLSYAIRWHGDRPALLWELQAHAGLPEVRLTTPSLDPAWSTTRPEGEALLAVVPPPERPARRSVTLPVTIEPVRRGDR